MSFRIEEKIVLTPSERDRLMTDLWSRGMADLYPARRIHSVYYETMDFRMFTESEEGVLPRRKIRLRRYPEQPQVRWALETKVSSVEGRFKTVHRPDAADVRRLLSVGLLDRHYGELFAQLTVEYRRQYFTLDGLRITFDQDIRYGVPGGRREAIERWTVCELKAPAAIPLDSIGAIVDIPRRRFSKFCNGMIALNLPGDTHCRTVRDGAAA